MSEELRPYGTDSTDPPAEPLTREEQYLSAIAGVTSSSDIPPKPLTRAEKYLNKIVENGGGGGGGTTDYSDLSNKPKINSVELSGNKSLADIGAQPTIDSSHKLSADNVDDTNTTNKFATATQLSQIGTNANNISSIQNSLAVGSTDDAKVLTASYSGGVGTYSWVTPSGGGAVSGVKGSEETNYRTGNVSISAANVGAIPTTEKGANNGVAALDSNGKIAAETLKAGALASGMTATTQAISDDSTKLATTAYVHDVVDALPSPMVFKGTLGSTGATISALPIDGSAAVGDTYKVVTDGTYVVEIDGSETYTQDAKRGDIFICRIKETSSNTWTYIPSGDEPSGTVTNVAVANSGGLTVNGSPITSSGTITVGHSNSVTAKTSSSLKKFTYDAYGHVTGSSELSTAESNALASGIDSTKVAQIETNKNNISSVQAQANWNTNNGVKNLSPYNNGTENAPLVIPCNFKSGERYIVSWDSITSTSSADSSRMVFMSGESAVSNIYYASHGGAGSTTLTLTADCDSLWIYAGSTYEVNKTVTLSKFMVCPATIADSTYAPYAMSNAELTAAIQALQDQLANQ